MDKKRYFTCVGLSIYFTRNYLVPLTKEEKKIKSNAFFIALDQIENSGFELV